MMGPSLMNWSRNQVILCQRGECLHLKQLFIGLNSKGTSKSLKTPTFSRSCPRVMNNARKGVRMLGECLLFSSKWKLQNLPLEKFRTQKKLGHEKFRTTNFSDARLSEYKNVRNFSWLMLTTTNRPLHLIRP